MASALEDALPSARARRALLWSIGGICALPSLLALTGIGLGADALSFPAGGAVEPNSSPWGDSVHRSLSGGFGHTIMEWTAFCTAAFTAILGCVYFCVRRDYVTPIIATALFWAGCMDALNAGVVDRLIDANTGHPGLIPITWTLGRFFNALLPIVGIGIILARRSQRPGPGSLVLFSAVSLLLGVAAYGLIEFLPASQSLREAGFTSGPLTRPWELAPLFLYLAAGCLLYPRFCRGRRDLFLICLWISVIPNAMAQMHMAFGSMALFDDHFNAAHLLKIFAYALPLAGVLLDCLLRYRNQAELNLNLTSEIATLRQAETALLQESETFRDFNRGLASSKQKLEDQRRELESINATLQLDKADAEDASWIKSKFLASMSHEIRTPMTALVGYVELLGRSSEKLPEDCRDWVAKMRWSADHLVCLLNDMLDLSKIEAGQMGVDLAPCNLAEIIGEVDSVMRPLASENLLEFGITYEGQIPETIRTDRMRLRQILLNLVSNAIKFTSEGSVLVRVSGRKGRNSKHDLVCIAVADTGVGIPEDKLHLLFQPFTQIHGESRGGTGLGLDISGRLARMLGGSIRVESEFGKGSTFSFELPSPCASGTEWVDASKAQIRARTVESRSAEQISLRGIRILAVDDNPDNREIISFLLEAAGANVELAENGAIGVEKALSAEQSGAPFDLILMDMRMPVMDGQRAVAKLRESGLTTPIIALTAHAMTGDAASCLGAGCDAYIGKPVVPDLLLGEIAQQLGLTATEVTSSQIPPPTSVLHSTMSDNPKFLPRLRKYVAGMHQTLEQLERTREQRDAEGLHEIVHRLHGTGASYGYADITAVARECERMLRLGRTTEEVESLVSSLTDLLRGAVAGLPEEAS